VGYTTPSTGRRKGLQEEFANEIADEAKGLRENEPPSRRDAAGFWHSHDSAKGFSTILASEAKNDDSD
jgi:hypothetical protein